MENRKITCDTCSNDLTTTGNSVGYRIVVGSEPIPSVDGAVTDVNEEPDFPQPLHFCGYKCFTQWANQFTMPSRSKIREAAIPPPREWLDEKYDS